MFDKQDAGFEVKIPANQNSRNPSIFLGVCSNEILQVGCEVVLLTATQAEFTNRRYGRPKLLFTDNDLGGSIAAIERRTGS